MTAPKIVATQNGGTAIAADFALERDEDFKVFADEESFIGKHATRRAKTVEHEQFDKALFL
jgi:hypothetical protein